MSVILVRVDLVSEVVEVIGHHDYVDDDSGDRDEVKLAEALVIALADLGGEQEEQRCYLHNTYAREIPRKSYKSSYLEYEAVLNGSGDYEKEGEAADGTDDVRDVIVEDALSDVTEPDSQSDDVNEGCSRACRVSEKITRETSCYKQQYI